MRTYKQFINEEFNPNIMGIDILADMLARTGYDKSTMLKLLQIVFKNDGDSGVKELFKEITQMEIDNISKGKYIFK
jgi:hypothetical protein